MMLVAMRNILTVEERRNAGRGPRRVETLTSVISLWQIFRDTEIQAEDNAIISKGRHTFKPVKIA